MICLRSAKHLCFSQVPFCSHRKITAQMERTGNDRAENTQHIDNQEDFVSFYHPFPTLWDIKRVQGYREPGAYPRNHKAGDTSGRKPVHHTAQTRILHTLGNLLTPITLTACLWIGGVDERTWKKLSQTPGEHSNSTHTHTHVRKVRGRQTEV